MMMTWSALDLIVSSDLQYGQKMMVSTQPIKDCRVNNVLLSIKGNLPYNGHYPSVFVSSLNDINSFLQKRTVYLNEDEVDILVDNLQDFVRM